MMRHIIRAFSPSQLVGIASIVALVHGAAAGGDPLGTNSIVHKVSTPNGRMELTVNESRILTLEKRIPQFQVNNPDVLQMTALSPTQVQVHAKQPGVTQVNLWDEEDEVYSLDVIVYGDARELTLLLQSEFPNSSLRLKPISNGLLISGYVDQPSHVTSIIQIAEEYYPKVISNITVGGVHQVLLHVKAMEVSRTKLRQLGLDWELLSDSWQVGATVGGGTGTVAFSVLGSPTAIFGVCDALREDDLLKILSEPTLVTVSGRPAYFHVGGKIPILKAQELGKVDIEYVKWGTKVDFVPIVLGNGRIRLEVRPHISEPDASQSVVLNGFSVPGFKEREVDTGVEMMAGQTLAIAGLIQNRIEANKRGIPWVADLPLVGVMFRRVEEETNEVEALILVTPELVAAMDPHQVPPCGPGMRTDTPCDWELYMKGHIEVPKCCPPGWEASVQPIGMNPMAVGPGGPPQVIVDDSGTISTVPSPPVPQPSRAPKTTPPPAPQDEAAPYADPAPVPQSPEPSLQPAQPEAAGSSASVHRRSPISLHPTAASSRKDPSRRNVQSNASGASEPRQLPGFVGPIGYDVAEK